MFRIDHSVGLRGAQGLRRSQFDLPWLTFSRSVDPVVLSGYSRASPLRIRACWPYRSATALATSAIAP